MSLIVARKKGRQLAIVSDTKLTLPNDRNVQQDELRHEKNSPVGVIKTVIINPNLCISFAGEIHHAEDALREINDDDTLLMAIEVLKKHHKVSEGRTEFLICAGKPEPIIYELKDDEPKVVQSSWIGHRDAFNRFQEGLAGKKGDAKEKDETTVNSKANVLITEMNLSFETNIQVNLFSKMSSAMDEVIEDGNIDSVGGFKVNVVFDEKFDYTKYGKIYRGNIELFGPGSHVIGHGTANEGAYSVNFFGASTNYKNVGLHIKQGKFGILYQRQDKGLLSPRVLKLDEVDFGDYVKEYCNIFPAFSTQDIVQKFILDGKAAFEDKDFAKAHSLFDKAQKEETGKKKAEWLFYKGISLLNLKDNISAMQVFQQAINIDNSYQQRVMQLLMKKR